MTCTSLLNCITQDACNASLQRVAFFDVSMPFLQTRRAGQVRKTPSNPALQFATLLLRVSDEAYQHNIRPAYRFHFACLTVKVFPAIVMVPVRALVPVLADTE